LILWWHSSKPRAASLLSWAVA